MKLKETESIKKKKGQEKKGEKRRLALVLPLSEFTLAPSLPCLLLPLPEFTLAPGLPCLLLPLSEFTLAPGLPSLSITLCLEYYVVGTGSSLSAQGHHRELFGIFA